MKNLTIARRYAKALLIIGKEDGQAEIYGKELDGFAKLVAREKELDVKNSFVYLDASLPLKAIFEIKKDKILKS